MPQLFGFLLALMAAGMLVVVLVQLAIFVLGTVLFAGAAMVAGVLMVRLWTALRWSLGAARARTTQTHYAQWLGEGALAIEPREAAQVATTERWTLAAACVTSGLALSTVVGLPRLQFLELVAPVWVSVVAVGLAIAGVWAAGHQRFLDWRRQGGGAATQSLLYPVLTWQGALESHRGLEQALDAYGANVETSACADVERFVAHHQQALLDNPEVVSDEIARLNSEYLRKASLARASWGRWQATDLLLQEVAQLVLANRSPGALRMLDDLLRTHRDAVGLLLKGDSAGFDDTLDAVHADAESLAVLTQDGTADEGPAGTSSNGGDATADTLKAAFDLLGLPPDSPLDRVQAVARRLMKIYHPDSGVVDDDARFKAVRSAWELIQQARRS